MSSTSSFSYRRALCSIACVLSSGILVHAAPIDSRAAPQFLTPGTANLSGNRTSPQFLKQGVAGQNTPFSSVWPPGNVPLLHHGGDSKSQSNPKDPEQPQSVNPKTEGPNSTLGSVKENLEAMLMLIDSDAEQRFVASDLDTVTSFGSNDEIQSNKALSDMVDKVFTSDSAEPGNDGWVATYADFLIEAGKSDSGSNSTAQFAVIQQYYSAWTNVQSDLKTITDAYQKETGKNVSNIGINMASAPIDDPTSRAELEKFAQSAAEKGSGAYNKSSWETYMKDNKTLTGLTPKFQELNMAIQVAYQGNFLKELEAAIFNFSMIVGGVADSSSAKYAPAWSATIVNTTAVSSKDADDLQANLDNSLHDATVSNTSFASSINDEAPPSTSAKASQAKSTSGSSARALRFRAVTSASAPAQTSKGSSMTASAKAPAHTPQKGKALAGSKKTSSALNVAAADDSKNGTAHSGDDVLAGVSTGNLTGTMMLVRFQAGAWKNDIGQFIQFAAKDQPDIMAKYFGSGTTGNGPLGREWTHAILVTTYKPNSTDLQTVQLLGMVWGVLPELAQAGSSSSSTNQTSGAQKPKSGKQTGNQKP